MNLLGRRCGKGNFHFTVAFNPEEGSHDIPALRGVESHIIGPQKQTEPK